MKEINELLNTYGLKSVSKPLDSEYIRLLKTAGIDEKNVSEVFAVGKDGKKTKRSDIFKVYRSLTRRIVIQDADVFIDSFLPELKGMPLLDWFMELMELKVTPFDQRRLLKFSFKNKWETDHLTTIMVKEHEKELDGLFPGYSLKKVFNPQKEEVRMKDDIMELVEQFVNIANRSEKLIKVAEKIELHMEFKAFDLLKKDG